MPRFAVEIVEKTSRVAIVEAKDADEAHVIAEALWSETDGSYGLFKEGETWHDVNTEYTEEVPDDDALMPVYLTADIEKETGKKIADVIAGK